MNDRLRGYAWGASIVGAWAWWDWNVSPGHPIAVAIGAWGVVGIAWWQDRRRRGKVS